MDLLPAVEAATLAQRANGIRESVVHLRALFWGQLGFCNLTRVNGKGKRFRV